MAARNTSQKTDNQKNDPEKNNDITNTTASGDEHGGKMNINTCSKEHLQSIPLMTGDRATMIINYRNNHGAFATMNRLKDVPGIGDQLMSTLRDNCYAGNIDEPSPKEGQIDEGL